MLGEAEARAWRAYTHMRVQVQGRLARDLALSSGLSEADYAVLVNVPEGPRGRLRHFELCEVLQWDPAFIAAPLQRACAVLGVRLIHSRSGQPAGRGKIERFFKTVRAQFLIELRMTETRSTSSSPNSRYPRHSEHAAVAARCGRST